MQLVVDTNIVVSAVLRASLTRALLLRPDLNLLSPEMLKEEFEKHRNELIEKSGLSKEQFDKATELVFMNIRILPRQVYAGFELEAKEIAPDKDDYPFFAAALSIGCPIWTNEKRLKKQEKIIVYNTEEIYRLLQAKGLV